jgi:HK97 family phage major capsid protein
VVTTQRGQPSGRFTDDRYQNLLDALDSSPNNRTFVDLLPPRLVAAKMREIRNDVHPDVLSSGGALIGVDPVLVIQTGMTASSAMLQNCELLTPLGNYQHILPTLDDVGNEGTVINANNPSTTVDINQFGRRKFNPRIFSSNRLKVSRIVEDDASALLPSVLFALGTRIGRRINREFTVGGGSSGPIGITQSAGVGVTAASASVIAVDEVLQLIGSVNAYYRQGASLMMNTATWTAMATLKDGEGQYLWRLAGLHEFPVVFNDHMPSIAAGATPILYGPLSVYKAFMLGSIEIQRFIEQYAKNYEVAYEGFLQADGALADASGNAVKTLQMAAE